MTTLVLTVVGDDRAGLVAAIAEVIDAHGGNWETSQLAELSGAFAGIIEVSVAPARSDELREALSVLDGLLTVVVQPAESEEAAPDARRSVTLHVIGNDHPGIVRDVTAALRSHDVNIERMTTETRDAAMSGGRLFEATIVAGVGANADVAAVTAAVERVAAEIQVDVTLA